MSESSERYSLEMSKSYDSSIEKLFVNPNRKKEWLVIYYGDGNEIDQKLIFYDDKFSKGKIFLPGEFYDEMDDS